MFKYLKGILRKAESLGVNITELHLTENIRSQELETKLFKQFSDFKINWVGVDGYAANYSLNANLNGQILVRKGTMCAAQILAHQFRDD